MYPCGNAARRDDAWIACAMGYKVAMLAARGKGGDFLPQAVKLRAGGGDDPNGCRSGGSRAAARRERGG